MFQLNGFQNPGFQSGNDYGVRALAVTSDLAIQEADLSFVNFQDLFDNTEPIGYEPFIPFMTGDHEYLRAMIRLKVTGDGISVPIINTLKAQVDLPDVFDAGFTVVSGSGTANVTFVRNFYIPPEVICTIKGGTVFVVPIVSNITRTGFTVELRDSNGNPIAGTVTWSAHGY